MNEIIQGDNLKAMRDMDSDTIDLVYLDPPFNTGRVWTGWENSQAENAEFGDVWTEEQKEKSGYDDMLKMICGKQSLYNYMTFMSLRLEEIRRIMKKTGTVYIHADDTAIHYIKVLCDHIFGEKNFRNEIIWKRTYAGKNDVKKKFGRIVDTILRYTKSDAFTFNMQYTPYTPEQLSHYKYADDDGRRYRLASISRPSIHGEARDYQTYTYKGHTKSWIWTKATMEQREKEGKIVIKPHALPQYKVYLNDRTGVVMSNLWTDIQRQPQDQHGYPTQKPLALLQRIILSSSNRNDIVLDPFCGSGSTCVAAYNNHRRFIGIDMSQQAADLCYHRVKESAGMFPIEIQRKSAE